MSDWKDIVKAVAPGIAGMLGGPLAATAVGALSKSLLGKDDGTADELAAVVAGASPDTLAKIKEVEATLKIELARAGVKLEEIAAGDRDSARKREVAAGDSWTPRIIAAGVFMAYGFAQYHVFMTPFDDDKMPLIMRVLGILDAAILAILYYYFGTSAGSKSKDAILDRVVNHMD